MKKTFLIFFFALFSTQLFAQKESGEYPWAKAAKIIEADEAKYKKAGQRQKAETPQKLKKKPEKKNDGENKKDSSG